MVGERKSDTPRSIDWWRLIGTASNISFKLLQPYAKRGLLSSSSLALTVCERFFVFWHQCDVILSAERYEIAFFNPLSVSAFK
jgi:hypothetical protein